MLTKVKYRDLKVGDVLIDHYGGSIEVTDIQPVVYHTGGTSDRTATMFFYGECSGKGSCKHAYREEVPLDGTCDLWGSDSTENQSLP